MNGRHGRSGRTLLPCLLLPCLPCSSCRAGRFAGLLGAVLLVISTGSHAQATSPDWKAVAGVETIEVLTVDEDQGARETKIWLTVLDGVGYIRTSRTTTWGKNVVRSPDIALRIEGVDYPVRVTFIEDPGLRARVIQSFRDKYGGFDAVINFIRGKDPHIMRVDARSSQ
jgi:hypothetical protein